MSLVAAVGPPFLAGKDLPLLEAVRVGAGLSLFEELEEFDRGFSPLADVSDLFDLKVRRSGIFVRRA
jgi:hypothetical protein